MQQSQALLFETFWNFFSQIFLICDWWNLCMLSLMQHEGQLWSVSCASESCFSVAPPFETCTIHVSPLFRKPETCSVLCISENTSSLDQSPCSSRTSGLSALPPPPVTSTAPGYLNLASPSIAFFSIVAFILKPSYTASSDSDTGQCWRLELDNLTCWQRSLVLPIHWTSMAS